MTAQISGLSMATTALRRRLGGLRRARWLLAASISFGAGSAMAAVIIAWTPPSVGPLAVAASMAGLSILSWLAVWGGRRAVRALAIHAQEAVARP